MNELLVERFFSVSVELTDGRSTQLKVRGESAAEAFKEVRSRADVRRVGKVSEIAESAFHSDIPAPVSRPAGSTDGNRSSRSDARHPGEQVQEHHQGEGHEPSAGSKTPREALIGFTISGPRVIRAARPLGYEQPFRNFRARPGAVNLPPPPEPAKPVFSPFGPVRGPVANDPSRPPVFSKPASAPAAEAAQPAPQAESPAPAAAPAPAVREYRIQKSRRQSGEPYLLQRGTWATQKGKRVFTVEWEKGFPSRENAEKQQKWLEQMAAEAAELNAEH